MYQTRYLFYGLLLVLRLMEASTLTCNYCSNFDALVSPCKEDPCDGGQCIKVEFLLEAYKKGSPLIGKTVWFAFCSLSNPCMLSLVALCQVLEYNLFGAGEASFKNCKIECANYNKFTSLTIEPQSPTLEATSMSSSFVTLHPSPTLEAGRTSSALAAGNQPSILVSSISPMTFATILSPSPLAQIILESRSTEHLKTSNPTLSLTFSAGQQSVADLSPTSTAITENQSPKTTDSSLQCTIYSNWDKLWTACHQKDCIEGTCGKIEFFFESVFDDTPRNQSMWLTDCIDREICGFHSAVLCLAIGFSPNQGSVIKLENCKVECADYDKYSSIAGHSSLTSTESGSSSVFFPTSTFASATGDQSSPQISASTLSASVQSTGSATGSQSSARILASFTTQSRLLSQTPSIVLSTLHLASGATISRSASEFSVTPNPISSATVGSNLLDFGGLVFSTASMPVQAAETTVGTSYVVPPTSSNAFATSTTDSQLSSAAHMPPSSYKTSLALSTSSVTFHQSFSTPSYLQWPSSMAITGLPPSTVSNLDQSSLASSSPVSSGPQRSTIAIVVQSSKDSTRIPSSLLASDSCFSRLASTSTTSALAGDFPLSEFAARNVSYTKALDTISSALASDTSQSRLVSQTQSIELPSLYPSSPIKTATVFSLSSTGAQYASPVAGLSSMTSVLDPFLSGLATIRNNTSTLVAVISNLSTYGSTFTVTSSTYPSAILANSSLSYCNYTLIGGSAYPAYSLEPGSSVLAICVAHTTYKPSSAFESGPGFFAMVVSLALALFEIMISN